MKKFGKEFKEFIMRGNVMDMAIGVIIATAFGAITNSLVNDVFMPLIGIIFGGVDFANLNVTVGESTIGIGTFIGTVVNFIIVALIVFTIVKAFNKAHEFAEARRKKEEAAAAEEEKPAGPTTEELLARILEELKKK